MSIILKEGEFSLKQTVYDRVMDAFTPEDNTKLAQFAIEKGLGEVVLTPESLKINKNGGGDLVIKAGNKTAHLTIGPGEWTAV